VIDPEGLLRHAEQLVETGRGRPTEAALRRGISATYYALFHDLTGHAASHLLGSCELEIQNEIRRSWSHSEISQLAEYVVDRAKVLLHAPNATLPGRLEALGPLLDVVASDAALVECLRLFNDMQERRHAADYDHGERFAKSHLVQACRNARIARRRLREASSAAREALFTLLTVRRVDFRQR
jgi:hypothetical protein